MGRRRGKECLVYRKDMNNDKEAGKQWRASGYSLTLEEWSEDCTGSGRL